MHNPVVLPWLEQNWLQLAECIRQDRIPQALLISGQTGLGKRWLIECYAQALLCNARLDDCMPCGNCHSCILIKAQTHPDLLVIEPEQAGKAIGIDVIRQLINRLTLKPQFDSSRVVIIHAADALNNAAANAFLKCLEEPTERTSIVLSAEKTSKLPATIRSRCQQWIISQPDSRIAIKWLKQQKIKDCELLLKLAQGSPLTAKEYAENDYLSVQSVYFNDWLNVASGTVNVVQLAEQWQKQEKVTLSVLLIWITEWVMALIKLAHQKDYPVEHRAALQKLLERLDLHMIYPFYDLLLLSRRQLDTQLNKQLMIEHLLIEWSRLNKR